MSNEAGEGNVTPVNCRANVRFSRSEYERMRRDRLLTGRSIPWLLKARYFKGELLPPAFDYEASRLMLRLLGNMANNMNQIARRVNAGITDRAHDQIEEILKHIRELRAMAARDYGDR